MKICFVGCPKRFESPWAEIQTRALRSWKQTDIDSEVCIVAPRADVESLPEGLADYAVVAKENDLSKLPMFADIMEVAYEHSDADLFCYLNSDIILPSNFGQVELDKLDKEFLIIGSRWDMSEGVAYPDSLNPDNLFAYLAENLKSGAVSLHRPTGIDYFLFKRGTFDGLKPLIIGRGGYDAALLAFCLRSGIQLVDATETFIILHQFHDYSHISGAKKRVMQGEDASYNRKAHDIEHSGPIILDASYSLRYGKLAKTNWRCGLIRRVELFLRFRIGMKYPSYLMRVLDRLLGRSMRSERAYALYVKELS